MTGDSDEGVAAAGAFVFFGAISDLPCLYRLVRRGRLAYPRRPVACLAGGTPGCRGLAADSDYSRRNRDDRKPALFCYLPVEHMVRGETVLIAEDGYLR